MTEEYKPCVLFGRSPFIDQVDVAQLCKKRTSVAMNSFGTMHAVNHLFFYDDYFEHLPGPRIHTPYWFKRKGDTLFCARPADRPYTKQVYQDGYAVLAFRYFVTSIALNWAILQGFRDIYLVGIDHKETAGKMPHFDGPPGRFVSACAHRKFKQYVRRCHNALPYVRIYQCNPAVKEQWALPFKSVEDIY